MALCHFGAHVDFHLQFSVQISIPPPPPPPRNIYLINGVFWEGRCLCSLKKKNKQKNTCTEAAIIAKLFLKPPSHVNVVILTWVKILVFRLKVLHFVFVFQMLALHVPGSVNLQLPIGSPMCYRVRRWEFLVQLHIWQLIQPQACEQNF